MKSDFLVLASVVGVLRLLAFAEPAWADSLRDVESCGECAAYETCIRSSHPFSDTSLYHCDLKKPAEALLGRYLVHLKIGSRTFDDRLEVALDEAGRLGGKMTVPGRFSAPLERIAITETGISFEILAREDGKAYRVRYEGTGQGPDGSFTGLATLPETGETLGRFTAERESAGGPDGRL